MAPHWFQELWRIITLALGMLAVGLLLNQPFLFLFLACLIYLSWHLYNLYQLDRWFHQSPRPRDLPDSPGIWGEVFYHFYRLQRRNRKRKRKLTSMLKRFRRSTAALPDAAVVLGPHYQIEWFNKSAQQLLGLHAPHDIRQPITNTLTHSTFQHYLSDQQYKDDKEGLKLQAPIDPNIMLRINVVPYTGSRHLLLARDVTKLHHLEQVRRDFVANVSHELRTPLTVISGFVETMADSDDECAEQWRRPLLLMAQQSTRMRNIIEDLLLLSKLESEPLSELERVDVPDLLHSIAEDAHLLSGEQKHHIELDVEPELKLYGRTSELRSAFSNLVFNAVRYTPENGYIHIRWYSDAQGIYFSVQDTGEGIAPEHLPRLTERFYRVDVARSRSQGGTGLGLAIVKHVLNHHEGQLHIESILGQGSTFRCQFPLKPKRLRQQESKVETNEDDETTNTRE